MKSQTRIVTFIISGILFCTLLYLGLRYQNTSARRPPDQYAGSIPQIQSRNDKDHDGINDQTDILQSALNYVAAGPRYKSKYYQGGYPDDSCGVCTDVVANALKNSGYDLMTLIQEDIAENP